MNKVVVLIALAFNIFLLIYIPYFWLLLATGFAATMFGYGLAALVGKAYHTLRGR